MKNKDNTINTKTVQEKKHRFTLLIGATLISLVFFCMYIHANYINTNATYNSDTSSYVTVDEIWNAEEGFFDGERLATLLQYIVNDETMMTNTAKMQGSVVMCAGGNLSSADIRQSTANGKTNNQDVQVVFNGLTWQVVYLSSDQDGNDILTLWLSSSQQDKWQGKARKQKKQSTPGPRRKM